MIDFASSTGLLNISAPTGAERRFADELCEKLKCRSELELSRDVMNTVVAHKKGNGVRTAICVLVDEPSFTVINTLCDGGYDIVYETLELVEGVMPAEVEDGKTATVAKKDGRTVLYADALKIGDCGTLKSKWSLTDEIISGDTLRYKLPAILLLEIALTAKSELDLHFVFATHSHAKWMSMRGLTHAVERIEPEEAIILELVAAASDKIQLEVAGSNYVSDKALCSGAISVAKELGILLAPFVSNKEYTAAQAVMETINTKVMTLCLPMRSGSEVKLEVIEDFLKLILGFLKQSR